MQVGHQFRQVGFLEILGPDAGVEATYAEEDGVGAVLDRRADAVPLPGRGEDFRLTEGSDEAGSGHENRKAYSALPCKEQLSPRQTGAALPGLPRGGHPALIEPMSDKLEEIFQMQQALNKRIGVETAGMTEEEKIKWVLNYLRAMQQEMAELTDSVPWKWWAKYQKFDEQNARVEVIDLFHFLISIAQVLGMSADDVYQAYLKKNAVNHQRQDSGYVKKDENDSRHI
jgi:dimeric dUTPase (all-alpha-NTP-PPase superfamily)